MVRPLGTAVLLLALLGVAAAGGDKRSPFEMVRYVDGTPQVQVEGEWYELVSLDGIRLERVMEACRALDDEKPGKRFCEDLPEALEGIGHTVGPTVDLVLRKPGSKSIVSKKQVPATERNRDRIRNARPWKGGARPVKRVQRVHATKPDRRYAWLTIRHHPKGTRSHIDGARAAQDLDQLEWLVENVLAYRHYRSITLKHEGPWDVRPAFDTVRHAARHGIPREDFHIMLRKLVALFGDGHSRVAGVKSALPHGPLPFALAAVGADVAAVDERGRPLDRARPYVREIDGRPIEDWLSKAARINARGSPQFQRRLALDFGRRARFVRRELGLEHADTVLVTLAGPGGSKKTRLPLARRRVPIPRLPTRASMPEGLGYIRIEDMSGRSMDVRKVIDELAAFRARQGRGLIIDVRGNGGGTRDILAALMPRLMPPDADPVVANVAHYRLPPGVSFDGQRGHLENRRLYPVTSRRLSKAERGAAQALASTFEPDWQPDPKLFTPLHAMVVTPAPAGVKPRFTGPIAVLIDEGCFSATDIFVGALELLPNVTLVGRPTGGGSGRSARYTLAHSGLDVKLSTMASFRPTGARYDGKGIEPDIRVEQTLAALAGEEDPVLDRAIEHLREKTKR